MDEKVKVGTMYCDECRTDFDVFVNGEGSEEGRAPQIYLHGFHFHLFGQVIEVPPLCIWITNPNTFIGEIENCLKALNALGEGYKKEEKE